MMAEFGASRGSFRAESSEEAEGVVPTSTAVKSLPPQPGPVRRRNQGRSPSPSRSPSLEEESLLV